MSRLIVKPVGGLCNRIRVIDSVLSLAAQAEREVLVIWEKSAELNCSYLDLFQSPEFEVIETRSTSRFRKPLFPTRRPKNWWQRQMLRRGFRRLNASLDRAVFFDDQSELIETLRPISPERFKSVADFDDEAYYHFRSVVQSILTGQTNYLSGCWRLVPSPRYSLNFVPHREIQDQVDAVTDSFGSKTIGLHIRGTDAQHSKQYGGVEPFRLAIDGEIEKDPAVQFFLATDEPSVKADLEQSYPGRIHVLAQLDYSRSRSENIQNAFVDLLSLAGTRRVYGSYFSTFSLLAADWFGLEEITVFRDGEFAVRGRKNE